MTDACKSINDNAGKANGVQTANADSSRCGQTFNSVAYGGISHPLFGRLTIGRHNSLQLETFGGYDPQTLSYAFSVMGYSGALSGAGSTEAARWDNSVRYSNKVGPVRVAALYSNGGDGTGIAGPAFGGDLGVDYGNASIDAVYQKIRGGLNLRSAADDTAGSALTSYVSNNTSWSVQGKYAIPVTTTTTVSLFSGYEHYEKAASNAYTTESQGGSESVAQSFDITNTAKYDVLFAGARLAVGSNWNVSTGFYHIHQNNWGVAGLGCTNAGLLCAGAFDEASLAVDYAFNKHYDLYAGLNYDVVSKGLANGMPGDQNGSGVGTTGSQDQMTVATGFRVRF